MKNIFLYLIISLFTFGLLFYISPLRKAAANKVKREIVIQHEASAQGIKTDTKNTGLKGLQKLAHTLLEKAGFANPTKIKVCLHDDTSCSNDTCIWMNSGWEFGPQEFVVAHEVAHVAKDDYLERCAYDLDDADIKAQEKEADLFACKLLCDSDRQEVVVERLKNVQEAIDQKWRQTDTNDHPTLQEMGDYISNFLEEYNENK